MFSHLCKVGIQRAKLVCTVSFTRKPAYEHITDPYRVDSTEPGRGRRSSARQTWKLLKYLDPSTPWKHFIPHVHKQLPLISSKETKHCNIKKINPPHPPPVIIANIISRPFFYWVCQLNEIISNCYLPLNPRCSQRTIVFSPTVRKFHLYSSWTSPCFSAL